jgi:hypothetical protein
MTGTATGEAGTRHYRFVKHTFDPPSGELREVRAALGDQAANPDVIETLPRRGYRFIPPVEVVAKSSSPQPPRPVLARLPVLAGIAALVATFAALTLVGTRGDSGGERTKGTRSHGFRRTRTFEGVFRGLVQVE